MVAAKLGSKACPQIVSLNLAIPELISHLIVTLTSKPLIVCDLDSQLLDSFLLTSNHDFFLLELHLEETLHIMGTTTGLIKFFGASAALTEDSWLGSETSWRLLPKTWSLDVNGRPKVGNIFLFSHESHIGWLIVLFC